MSKEMLIIALGLLTIVETQLGIPYHPWGVALYILTGIAVAVMGFLLRGESLGRDHVAEPLSKKSSYTFAESAPASHPTVASETHEHQEGTNAL